jgi:phage terminase large subunit-like protein
MVGQLYDKWQADVVLGEENFGGAMVKETITNAYPEINYKKITVTKGKHLRAEPQSGNYENGKVLHVGNYVDLEAEMSQFSTAGYLGEDSPNRVDALVMCLSELLSKPKYDIGVF